MTGIFFLAVLLARIAGCEALWGRGRGLFGDVQLRRVVSFMGAGRLSRRQRAALS